VSGYGPNDFQGIINIWPNGGAQNMVRDHTMCDAESQDYPEQVTPSISDKADKSIFKTDKSIFKKFLSLPEFSPYYTGRRQGEGPLKR
jgi:hypothetical protein